MLFFSPSFWRMHSPQPTIAPLFFFTKFPASTSERRSHAYEDMGGVGGGSRERKNTLITKSNYIYKDPPKK